MTARLAPAGLICILDWPARLKVSRKEATPGSRPHGSPGFAKTPAPGGLDLDGLARLHEKRKTARQFLYLSVGPDQPLSSGNAEPIRPRAIR